MKEEVLRLVNLARTAMGLPTLAVLPLGFPGKPSSCVIAKALGVPCGLYGVHLPNPAREAVAKAWGTRIDGDERVKFPQPIPSFIIEFDSGSIPELRA